MLTISSLLSRFAKDRRGNIAISAGLTAPLFIGILALGVDYGYLTLQKRQLQQTADLAAISAAANVTDAERRCSNILHSTAWTSASGRRRGC